jgi:hypothetical protein
VAETFPPTKNYTKIDYESVLCVFKIIDQEHLYKVTHGKVKNREFLAILLTYPQKIETPIHHPIQFHISLLIQIPHFLPFENTQ